jgi:hypothetical protein
LSEARKRQEETRNSFAELESFASVGVQTHAREAMEALTGAFNYAAEFQPTEASAKFAQYQAEYGKFAEQVNHDIEHFNGLIYREFTPMWRALLSRLRKEPLPYSSKSHFAELRNPEEGLEPQISSDGPVRLQQVAPSK